MRTSLHGGGGVLMPLKLVILDSGGGGTVQISR